MITKAIVDRYQQQYLYKVLSGDDLRSSSALYTYAAFLNKLPQQYDLAPLYLKVFHTNNQFAVDALLKNKDPWGFFDFIRIANYYIVSEIFNTLKTYKRNNLYIKTRQVFCRFLNRLYSTSKAGYNIYPLTIADLNSMAKFLDESKDQSDPLNRGILDLLIGLGELDRPAETNHEMQIVGRQAARIRTDFLDQKRSLKSSFPGLLLENESNVQMGVQPDTFVAD